MMSKTYYQITKKRFNKLVKEGKIEKVFITELSEDKINVDIFKRQGLYLISKVE
jgi:hypothetical protein